MLIPEHKLLKYPQVNVFVDTDNDRINKGVYRLHFITSNGVAFFFADPTGVPVALGKGDFNKIAPSDSRFQFLIDYLTGVLSVRLLDGDGTVRIIGCILKIANARFNVHGTARDFGLYFDKVYATKYAGASSKYLTVSEFPAPTVTVEAMQTDNDADFKLFDDLCSSDDGLLQDVKLQQEQ